MFFLDAFLLKIISSVSFLPDIAVFPTFFPAECFIVHGRHINIHQMGDTAVTARFWRTVGGCYLSVLAVLPPVASAGLEPWYTGWMGAKTATSHTPPGR